MSTESKYLHIVIDTPEEYFIAVFTGFIDDIPVFKRVDAQLYIHESDLKPAAECAKKLNEAFPVLVAVTKPSRKKTKGQ